MNNVTRRQELPPLGSCSTATGGGRQCSEGLCRGRHGLHHLRWAFLVGGLSCCCAWALERPDSVAVARGLVVPRHAGLSQTRNRTRAPRTGRWILNHEPPGVPSRVFFSFYCACLTSCQTFTPHTQALGCCACSWSWGFVCRRRFPCVACTLLTRPPGPRVNSRRRFYTVDLVSVSMKPLICLSCHSI